jgi:ZIP family zinc transporter
MLTIAPPPARVISSLAAVAGYSVFRHFSDAAVSATTGVAAGAILAITVAGFLAAFILTKLGG